MPDGSVRKEVITRDQDNQHLKTEVIDTKTETEYQFGGVYEPIRRRADAWLTRKITEYQDKHGHSDHSRSDHGGRITPPDKYRRRSTQTNTEQTNPQQGNIGDFPHFDARLRLRYREHNGSIFYENGGRDHGEGYIAPRTRNI